MHVTCPECGAGYFANEDGCTRCAMTAQSAARKAERRALLGDGPAAPLSIDELWAVLGKIPPGRVQCRNTFSPQRPRPGQR